VDVELSSVGERKKVWKDKQVGDLAGSAVHMGSGRGTGGEQGEGKKSRLAGRRGERLEVGVGAGG
jgi:hypothetical protein